MSQNISAPRVFVSYSWTSDGHAAWVMDLATRLRTDGVDVILDRWDLLPGQDKFLFMEQMASDASVDKVVVVCDHRYAQKADSREGGVGTESTIISQQIYEQSDAGRFVAVVAECDNDGKPFLPIFLKAKIYFDLSDPRRFESSYEDLIRDLCGRPRHAKPPIGKLPTFLLEEGRRPAATTYARRAFEDAVLHDRRHAAGLARDYLIALEGEWEALSQALKNDLANISRNNQQIEIEKSKADKIWGRCEELLPLRDEFTDFVAFAAQYGGDRRIFDEFSLFFERSLRLCRAQRVENQLIAFALKEALLYALVVLIAAERFEAAAAILSRYYRNPSEDNRDTNGLVRFGVFYAHVERLREGLTLGLDELYGKHRWISVEGQTLKARASDNWMHPLVTFESLQEVDFVLHWRWLLDARLERYGKKWWPSTVHGYFEHREIPLALCIRARSKNYFREFKMLLGVESKQELQMRSQSLLDENIAVLKDGWNGSFSQITDFAQLDTI